MSVAARTEPLTYASGASEPEVVWRAESVSAMAPVLTRDVLERAGRIHRSLGTSNVQRTTLLGLLLAQLDGVHFQTICELLAVKPARLEKLMHGEDQVPGAFEDRWEELSEALRNLHSVIRPEATERWLNTRIPGLDNRTPLEMIRKGGVKRVVALTRSYREPSFS